MCIAIPARLVAFLDPEGFSARVEVGGVPRVVNTALLCGGPDAVAEGDWVLVHAGSAVAKIGAEEARETQALLMQFG